MKKIIITALVALVACMGATAQGIIFRDVPLHEALRLARTEKKLVFVDCYTDWCGPCQKMATEVFTLKEAGDYFNKRFVCVKIDMEKGEGPDIKEKYNVQGYPTFLILDADGTEIHREGGSWPLSSFINRIEAGLRESKPLAKLKEEFDHGTISKHDLTDYWLLADGYARPAIEPVLCGMLTKSDKLKQVYWPLVAAGADSPLGEGMDFVLKNRRKLEKNIGKEEIDAAIHKSFYRTVLPLITGNSFRKEQDDISAVLAKLATVDFDGKAEIEALVELGEAKQESNPDRYIDVLFANYRDIKPSTLLTAMGGTPLPEGSAAKPYYERLAELSTELHANFSGLRNMDIRANAYRRLANVGVYWEDFDSFDDALAQAQKERRPVFMDCYTTWCGPCKHMADNVFTQEEVGDYFNRKFINIKIDMEKGEGPELIKRFGVRAFPTFVVIDADGSMRHMIVGGGEGKAFISRVEEAFDDDKALGVMARKFESGEGGTEFAVKYIAALREVNAVKAGEIAGQVFASLSDEQRFLPENWPIFADAPDDSEPGKFFLGHLDRFRASIPIEDIGKKLSDPLSQRLSAILNGQEKGVTAADLDPIIAQIKSYGPFEGAERLLAHAEVAKLLFAGEKDVDKYRIATENVSPGKLPLNLFTLKGRDLSPQQEQEWKAWWRELAVRANPGVREYLEKISE